MNKVVEREAFPDSIRFCGVDKKKEFLFNMEKAFCASLVRRENSDTETTE